MGQDIKLTASDGFELGGYRADPAGAPKAAIVVIQEIFGVNHHIRAVCDRLAGAGYVAIAPSIFDRSEPNFQCGYSPDEVANARKFIANPDWPAMLRDSQARSTRSRASARSASSASALVAALPMRPRPNYPASRRPSAIMAAPSCALPTTSQRCRCNCTLAKRMPAFP